MARWHTRTVTHSCGHTHDWAVTQHDIRNGALEYRARRPCPACERQRADADLQSAAATLGRKGGQGGTGEAKRRGDSAYYSRLNPDPAAGGRKGAEARWAPVRVRVNEKNGCKQCWARLREMEPDLPDFVDTQFEVARHTWDTIHVCPHDPSAYARGILLRVDD